MSKIRVAAVSYLNTKPLLYGLKQYPLSEAITLLEDYPAKIAQLLAAGEVDLALIPVAAIPRVPQAHIVTDYCIGADGPVASVCLFSEVPLAQIEQVYLDYQSRTSVNLARLLLREYWKKDVEFIDAAGEEYRHQIQGTTAGVVIGDRALEQRLQSTYIYDLAEAWKAFTGLPFVFAAWVANKPLKPGFLAGFNEAVGAGFAHLDAIIAENPFPHFDLKHYYTRCISYALTAEKRKGLGLFLKLLEQKIPTSF